MVINKKLIAFLFFTVVGIGISSIIIKNNMDSTEADIDSISNSIKDVYTEVMESDGYIYILRGVCEEDPRVSDLENFLFMTPFGGDASWSEHDAGNTDSKWQSHTIDTNIALYWAKGGGDMSSNGYIAYKRMFKEDFAEAVFGGLFGEYQVGLPGKIHYDGFIKINHSTTYNEAVNMLRSRGVKIIF